MSIDATAEGTAAFDAGREVPDEYDVFCEACGYSLVGLTGDRCPECGQTFEPKELPFARVPWLHRRRLGRVRAYVKTVAFVCLRPRQFAQELCRPVRISANDARSFRVMTLWLATAGVMIATIAIPFTILQWVNTRASIGPFPIKLAVYFGLIPLTSAAGFHVAIRMATDMPLFIWKGLPSISPMQMSPIHHYACAPLALLPIPALLAGFAFYSTAASWSFRDAAWFSSAFACPVAILLLWLWVVALIFLRVSTGARAGRVLALAFYLPLHWVMMSFLGFVSGGFLQGIAYAALNKPYR